MALPTQYRAELLTGDVRASAWARATDFYAGYERYRASCAHARSGCFGSGPSPPEEGPGIWRSPEFMACLANRRCQIVDRTRGPVLLAICVLFRSPTSTDLVLAAFAPLSTGWARNTAPRATRFF